MKRLAQMACAVSVMAFGGAAMADPVDDTLILNEDITMVTRTAAPAHLEDAVDEIHVRGEMIVSPFDHSTQRTQALYYSYFSLSDVIRCYCMHTRSS